MPVLAGTLSTRLLVRALVLALVLQVPVLDSDSPQQVHPTRLRSLALTCLDSVPRRGQRWQGKGPSDREVRFRRMPWNLASRSPEMTRLPPLPLPLPPLPPLLLLVRRLRSLVLYRCSCSRTSSFTDAVQWVQ
jgi:hypothetical protein